MSKIICNQIDFVFAREIRLMTPAQILLVPGAAWKKLTVTEKPVYNSDIKQNPAGPLREETVTAQTRHNVDAVLKQFPDFPVVLRMKTDDSTFYVGSQRYPAITEVSDDRIHDNYTFKVKLIP
jgi:hypothetical protein